MFGFIKEILIELLTSVVYASKHTKYVFLSKQIWATQPNFINLHPNEYTQGLCYFLFAVNLDRYVWSCDFLNNLSNKECVPKKTKFKSKCFQHDYRNK